MMIFLVDKLNLLKTVAEGRRFVCTLCKYTQKILYLGCVRLFSCAGIDKV